MNGKAQPPKATPAEDRQSAEESPARAAAEAEPDQHLGALEMDRPDQPGQGNPNLPALDGDGQPKDWKKICEDVIGAHVDESEGG